LFQIYLQLVPQLQRWTISVPLFAHFRLLFIWD
jgi:hypothetical protein